MRFRLAGMTGGLAVGVTAAVAIACAVGTYLYSIHHFKTLLAGARATALTQGELIRAGLEHQMLENDRTLIERMIQTFGNEPQVERVMLLDRRGAAAVLQRAAGAERRPDPELADLSGLPPLPPRAADLEPGHRDG